MSQRTLGLISGSVFVGALAVLQALRLAESPDKSSALVQGLTAFIVLAFGISATLIVPRIASARNWRKAIESAPDSDFELVAVGYANSDTLVSSNVKIGLFVTPEHLVTASFDGGFDPVTETSLAAVEVVTIEQLDSRSSWETQLQVSGEGMNPLYITLEGWRFLPRRRLREVGDRARDRIISRKRAFEKMGVDHRRPSADDRS